MSLGQQLMASSLPEKHRHERFRTSNINNLRPLDHRYGVSGVPILAYVIGSGPGAEDHHFLGSRTEIRNLDQNDD